VSRGARYHSKRSLKSGGRLHAYTLPRSLGMWHHVLTLAWPPQTSGNIVVWRPITRHIVQVRVLELLRIKVARAPSPRWMLCNTLYVWNMRRHLVHEHGPRFQVGRLSLACIHRMFTGTCFLFARVWPCPCGAHVAFELESPMRLNEKLPSCEARSARCTRNAVDTVETTDSDVARGRTKRTFPSGLPFASTSYLRLKHWTLHMSTFGCGSSGGTPHAHMALESTRCLSDMFECLSTLWVTSLPFACVRCCA